MLDMVRSLLFKKKREWNVTIDKAVTPVVFEGIKYSRKSKLDVSRQTVSEWLERGGLKDFAANGLHKKGLEFFFSAQILDIREAHAVLDAAGGKSNYLEAVKRNSRTRQLFLTDHIFEGIKQAENGVSIVGGDISSIHLPDKSIDRIACHHAFEHFQDNKDIEFIKESYRLLKDHGSVVIIPLFLVDNYVECWNMDTQKHFDRNACVIIDKSASIPGADDDGHFARFYSNESLIARIITPAEKLGFKCEIIECQIDGKSIPDMERNFGSLINKPLRAIKFCKEV